MAAFSKLAHGARFRPARTHMPGAPVADRRRRTQKLVQAGPATAPLAQRPAARHSAFPAAEGSRAGSDAEAIAATQYGGAESIPLRPDGSLAIEPGKQTDLGAARDTSVAVPVPSKRQSPLVYLVPAVAFLGIAGAGVWKLTERPTPNPSGAPALTAEPAPTAPPSAAPSASARAATIETAFVADASTTNTVPTPPAPPPPSVQKKSSVPAPPAPPAPRPSRMGRRT